MPKPLDEKEVQEVRSLRTQGVMMKDIAEMLGISKSTVNRIINKHGFYTDDTSPGLTPKPLTPSSDLDQAIEQWTGILREAAQAKVLREENVRLRNQLAACQNELKIVQSSISKRTDQINQFQLAKQQGLIN